MEEQQVKNIMGTTRAGYSGIDRDEFIALAQKVGFPSAAELARFIGADRRNVRQWYDGDTHVPVPVVMVLRLMEHFELSPHNVVEITGEAP
jgi:hypothetical protein